MMLSNKDNVERFVCALLPNDMDSEDLQLAMEMHQEFDLSEVFALSRDAFDAWANDPENKELYKSGPSACPTT